MRPHWPAWLLAGLCLTAPSVARAAPGFTDRCDDALRAAQIDDLVTRLRAVDDDGCRLGRVDTEGHRTVIDWRRGARLHTVLLAPRGCLVEPTHTGLDLAAHLPHALTACPNAHAALEAFITTPHSLAPILKDGGWHPDAPALADPRIIAIILFLAAALLALAIAVRDRRAARARDDRRWLALSVLLFLVGLLARFAVTAAPANWYGAFLPHSGWGDLRFGAAASVLQSAVRAIFPWTVDTAFTLFRVLGAFAVPLTVLLARRLGGSLAAAALAGSLVAFAPTPVRLSASSSEHVVAATLALAAWVTWLRTAGDPTILPRLLAIVLVALAALTRIDCLPQLALIPLWTILHTRPEWLPLRRRLHDAGFYLLTLALIALYGYVDIVRPSHHPGPALHGIIHAAKHLLSQFWTVAVAPPHWITASTLIIAILGLLAARGWRWPLAVLLSLACIFIPLGRTLLHDGLTGARYFVLLPALLAVCSVPLLTWLAARWPTRRTHLLVPGLAALELLLARPGWRHETTFQAEHRFLRDALADPHLGECTLWYVRPRQPTSEPDLDCCLSPEHSPLALQYPRIRFTDRPPDDTNCHLYYTGAICSLDPALAPDSPQAAARILAACELLGRQPAHEVARATVPQGTITPRSSTAPTVSLKIRGQRD
jgi:hypothetical protein